ncbi:hypothetical protein G9C98_007644 [Cotesia typhae]|uniref:Voltage-dependent anion-selective channel protein 3 n=1 Tax=Cotesia typhae TaxID=2053667 RepID=A0A8J5QZJ8_9HYME|nr:hypothetical protein G9C98_007644 [Cotesia typhae]
MAPPTYGDLGKSARDVFGRGYHFGLLKLDVKTKTESGVEFCSGGFSNQDTGIVVGNLETKYKIKESKTGKLKTTYKHENVSATADFDLSLNAAPLIHSTAVIGYQGWLAGYQTSFDAQRNKITKNNFALGFTAKDFGVHTSVNNGREFNGSIYHKVKPGLEGAISIAWNSSNNSTQFGLGTKYDLDNDACVRAKVNSQLQIGLGYQQKMREGVTLSLSTNIDGKNFGSGGHKIGLALDLEA